MQISSSLNLPRPRDVAGDVELGAEGDALHLVDAQRADAVAKDGEVSAPAEPVAERLDVEEEAAKYLTRQERTGIEATVHRSICQEAD